METYHLSFDPELQEMIAEGRGLMSVWQRLGQRVERMRYYHYPTCPRCGRRCAEMLPPDLHLLLNDDHLWIGSPLMRTLFKAFVYGEYRFAFRYCPLSSHEERLTGHLISELFSALAAVGSAVSKKSLELYGTEIELDFAYEDLAAGRRETYTGADFGIVFYVNLPGMPSPHIRSAAFQAKKITGGGGSASIDINQLKDIISFAGNDGAYYCFYDCDGGTCLSPLVSSAYQIALDISGHVEPIEHLPTAGTRAVNALELSNCSLAEYLIFSMVFRGRGHASSNLHEAVDYLSHPGSPDTPGGGNGPVKRIAVVTVGSTHQQDIQGLPALLSKGE